MKKLHFIFPFLLLIGGCYKGFVAKEGEILTKYLQPEILRELTEEPSDSIWIIDVRPVNAYKKGHIPTAKSFPSSEIINRLDEIPREKYLIIYCETGGRAQMVIKKLMENGYQRIINWGGYKRWPWELVK